MNSKKRKIGLLTLLAATIFTTGFTSISNTPQAMYRVYLKGKSLGLIESKQSFENYIDEKQDEIKKKYNVDKVYAPTDLDIVKEITFDSNIKTNQEIYDEIKDLCNKNKRNRFQR